MRLYALLFCCSASMVHSAELTNNALNHPYIGLSASEIVTIFPHYLGEPQASTDCYYLSPPQREKGFHFMIVNEQVVRLDSDSVVVEQAVAIGTPLDALLQLYPEARVAPHPYLGNAGHQVDVELADELFIIFELELELEQGQVVRYRMGRSPEVGFIEGCS